MSAAPAWEAFLEGAGWQGAARTPLAGDAGARRYLRLTAPGGCTAILSADPGGAAPVERFVDAARRLERAGLAPPEILAAAPEAGLMLLEDLGDALMARVLAGAPAREASLYLRATEDLLRLRGADTGGLPVLDADALTDLADLAWHEWAGADGVPPWRARLRAALREHAGGAPVPVLRDCHAENLILDPAGRLRVIDFQDMAAGPEGYDLVSLLEDARRDVGAEARAACLSLWRRETGTAPDALEARLAALGTQRALRILGVFARLARRGRPAYLAHAPRVRAHLTAGLAHPALSGLRAAVDLPAAPAGVPA